MDGSFVANLGQARQATTITLGQEAADGFTRGMVTATNTASVQGWSAQEIANLKRLPLRIQEDGVAEHRETIEAVRRDCK